MEIWKPAKLHPDEAINAMLNVALELARLTDKIDSVGDQLTDSINGIGGCEQENEEQG